MKICYVPMDDRPCNISWVTRLLDKDEIEIFKFAASSTPAGFESFTELALECDALCVSLDALCFGSLIDSRKPDFKLERALERLEVLKFIHNVKPEMPIHAFGAIMRASISALSSGDLDEYNAMSAYSFYAGKSDFEFKRGHSDQGHADLLRALDYAKKISAKTLNSYRFVRERNHQINMLSAKLAAEGVLTTLMLLQEDAPIHGFHRIEQAKLLDFIKEQGAKNIYLHNGADEGGMMIAARLFSDEAVTINVVYDSGNGDFTALYEDRLFSENLDDYMRYLKLKNAESEYALLIHAPKDGVQRESQVQAEYPDDVSETIKITQRLVDEGKRVYLLDIAYANGGSLKLVEALVNQGLAEKLAGYSAWNTTGNSLGSLLAQMQFDLRGRSDEQASNRFKWARMLDDTLYQSEVRFICYNTARQRGDDVLNLRDKAAALEDVRRFMAEALKKYDVPIKLRESVENPNAEYICDISLPWSRLFEVDINVVPCSGAY